MINKEDITPIGNTGKTHGIKGELSVTFDKTNFDEDKTPFFVFDIDGIFVPFFIDDFRFKTDTTALYKFDGINTEEQARELSNKTIFIENRFLQEETPDEAGIHFFIGFTVEDKEAGILGKITDVEDSTENVLFVIDNKKEELLIPATDYFITEIDEENKIIYMDLPAGLVDMNLAETDE